MSKPVHVRVELSKNARKENSDKSFKWLLASFTKRVSEAGVISEYKQKQVYESKGQKARRKKKERMISHLKEKKDIISRHNGYFPRDSQNQY